MKPLKCQLVLLVWNTVLALVVPKVKGAQIVLNILLLGEKEAAHLGVNVARVETVTFLLASLLTGMAVSVSGAIGYLGLIVPHLGRMVVGSDHRTLLPAAALGGAIFLVISDTLARTIVSPAELPVGAVTAVAGAPVFIYLLRRAAR